MNCQVAHNLMQLELDGELGAGQREELRAHCQECAACARRREQLRVIRGAARGLAAMTAPAETRSLVFSSPRVVRRRWWAMPMAAAAGIALVIGAYLAFSAARHSVTAPQFAKVPTPTPTVVQKPSSTPAENPSLALRANEENPSLALRASEQHGDAGDKVEVNIDDPNVITVPYKTDNPKVTILWIYPKVEMAAAAKASGQQPS